MLQKHFPFLAVGILAGLGVGCGDGGPPLGTVTGTITMNGQPVPRLKVTFVPVGKKGSTSSGATDENGEYQLMYNHRRAGAQLGKHDVILENPEIQTDESGSLIPVVYVKIPKKYRQPGVLTAEVKPGKNEQDFALDPNNGP